MENINIGIANLIVSSKLNESYFNDSLITESKETAFKFLDVIKNSPLLQLEFKVYDSIENKHIDNDITATRYIDNNVKLFEVYTLKEINEAHDKLKPFINENNNLNQDKIQLYEAINVLITEPLKDYNDIDVDKVHESFTLVLNHIKKEKISETESFDKTNINDDVIQIAVNKFNEKYDSLLEDDRNLVQKLIKSSNKEKESLLESYKNENLNILLNTDTKDDAQAAENVKNAINKINEMTFDSKTVNDAIISLHELKKDLLS